MTRFPAIPDAELSAEQRRVVEAIIAGPRGSLRGPFVPLLRSPRLADHVQRLGEHLRFGKTLPADVTEIAILVTARACRAQFEWHVHAPLAAAAGVPEPVIAAIGRSERPEAPPPPCCSPTTSSRPCTATGRWTSGCSCKRATVGANTAWSS